MNNIKLTKKDKEVLTNNISIGTLDNICKDAYNKTCYPVTNGLIDINIDC